MERYDAAIIGAGPDGLIAAHRLASSGLKVVVFDRREISGGRAATREFHPGFHASEFADELEPLPPELFWSLDPPRHGALLMSSPASACLSAEGVSVLHRDDARAARVAGPTGQALAAFRGEVAETLRAISRRSRRVATLPRFELPWRRPRRQSWQGEDWGMQSLAERLASRVTSAKIGLHLAADALSGASASPYHIGSALHLLRGMQMSGSPSGGLSSLGMALERAARKAGVEIRLNCDVHDVPADKGVANAVILADGEVVSSRAIVSTLDLKRTFLGLVPWGALDAAASRNVARFRISGARARVLIALDAPPEFVFAADAPEAMLGPIQVVDDLDGFARSHDSWRAGIVPETLPVTLRVPSFADPSLAPPGKAVMTATLGYVPSRLFDGDWTAAKRGRLVKIALDAAERAAPGTGARVVSVTTIIAQDIEHALGCTDGDLDGGELAPDQVLGFRPFPEWQDGRTSIRGLYLAGPSSAPAPFILGGGAVLAAEAIIADLRSGRLK